MNKRLSRNILYGLTMLAFIGILLYGIRWDPMSEDAFGDRANANAELMAELEASAREEAKAQAMAEALREQSVHGKGFEEIALEIESTGGDQEILLFRQQEAAYFFLPSFADADELIWKYDEGKYRLALDGEAVRDGDRLELALGESKTIVYTRQGQETVTCSLTLLQSDTVPAVFIETDSGSMAYLDADKIHEEVGNFLCVLADGTVDSAGRLGKVSGRGYSSFNAPKKSYGIRFAVATDVLGMGRARKWVLQANAYDLSRMRNRVVYDLAASMGVPYAVDCAYADVYFNGEYAGNYLLCERVEVARERMEIGNGCLLEGVFASRVEEEAEYSTFLGSSAGWYEIKHPKNISDERLGEMQALMDEVAQLIEQSDSKEAYEELKSLVDIESFIQMFLLDELSNEADLNRASTFYFTADDGKLYAGPVWDYDRSLGNVKSSAYELLDCFTVGLGEKLFKSPYFREDVVQSYNACYRDLIASYESSYIDKLQQEIDASIAMDTIRWSDEGLNKYTIFNDAYDNFDDGVAYLKDYFGIRYRLLDDILNEPEKYNQVEFVNTGATTEYVSQRLWVAHGEMLPADVMEYLAGRYECDIWYTQDGMEYEAALVMEDVRLLSGRIEDAAGQ